MGRGTFIVGLSARVVAIIACVPLLLCVTLAQSNEAQLGFSFQFGERSATRNCHFEASAAR